ncbi:MAG: low specificity L-threonine aldolase, partial [Candidatus Nanopelagicales bacterium]
EAFPVFNGTGANVVALAAMTTRFGSVVCTSTAHIHVDECGAPEKVGGVKLLTIPTYDGKLTPELIDLEARGMDDVHRAQPQVVSITQTTELGTAYSVEEIRAICDHAHSLGLSVHLDGARIANAAAHLGVPLRAFTTDAGVDVVSFGGTKNGLMLGEAVVVLNPSAAPHLDYVRKSSTQLASKMRFVSAQLEALLGTDLWIENASHANAMAQRLAAGLEGLVEMPRPVQANAVFVRLPQAVIDDLRRTYEFYDWDETVGEVRWMTAWDHTPEEVDAFVLDVRAALARAGAPVPA